MVQALNKKQFPKVHFESNLHPQNEANEQILKYEQKANPSFGCSLCASAYVTSPAVRIMSFKS